jgi:predicted metal-dependent peptidase
MNDTTPQAPRRVWPAAQLHEALSRAITDLLLREPFYGHFLQGIPRMFSDGIETACVRLSSAGFSLVFNPGFLMEELDSDTRLGVLKHEVLHLVLRHLERSVPYQGQRTLYNVAADLVVNQYVDEAELPSSALRLSSFPELKLEEHQSVEYYLERLKPIFKTVTMRLSVGIFDGHGDWFPSQSPVGGDPEGYGSLEKAMLDEHIRKAYRSHLGSRSGYGHLPAGIEGLLKAHENRLKPTLDWKALLRRFTDGSRSNGIEYTQKRISRRFGTRPGIRIRRRQSILVAIDTSGSVSEERISEFFAEIDAVWRQGSHVTVIECDAEAYGPYPYRGRVPEKVNGRGGTCFDPVFRHVNESHVRYDGCIYLTDGDGPAPTIHPRCRLLWVITPDGSKSHPGIGSLVRMDGKSV